MQALAPCTRSRWALPPAPPLGPFHFPRPLEIEVLFIAEYRSIMPFPRYSGAQADPDKVQGFPAQRRHRHELVDRYPYQN
jgi:hypothetical protein